MRVIAYDIFQNPKVLEMDIPYMSIEEILPQADVVSLHVPLLPSTYEIMNKPRLVRKMGLWFGRMKGRAGFAHHIIFVRGV
jgi:phosphoglycerate dehydrogenase-like enzyme